MCLAVGSLALDMEYNMRNDTEHIRTQVRTRKVVSSIQVSKVIYRSHLEASVLLRILLVEDQLGESQMRLCIMFSL